jgi:SAM-dependent methyltransferase
MSYAEITFRDRNPVKRWLQRHRLAFAIELCRRTVRAPAAICDFGAGNGELCKLLAECYRDARLVCYEPKHSLMLEARKNLKAVAGTEFFEDLRGIESGTMDVVFCLEVFEHLPPRETADALQAIHDLLKPDGLAVIGVPVEIGFPALYKGVFRMSRRYGAFDANVRNVVRSSLFCPPKDRPVSEISPGLEFHRQHTGFDFRSLGTSIRQKFRLEKTSASPFPLFGSWLMPELYFVARKVDSGSGTVRGS